jgi:hypothetical protein
MLENWIFMMGVLGFCLYVLFVGCMLLIAPDMTRPSFCTTSSERVYITASGCEIEFGGTRGL